VKPNHRFGIATTERAMFFLRSHKPGLPIPVVVGGLAHIGTRIAGRKSSAPDGPSIFVFSQKRQV